MMVIPDTVLQSMLDASMSGLGTLKMFLMLANVTPDGTTTYATAHSGVSGWADVQTLTGLTSAALSAHVAYVTWDNVTFVNTTGGAVNVYGYGVCDSAGTVLYWAERAPSAPVSVGAGQSYVVGPYFSRENQT